MDENSEVEVEGIGEGREQGGRYDHRRGEVKQAQGDVDSFESKFRLREPSGQQGGSGRRAHN